MNVPPSETGGYYAGNCVVITGAIGSEELVALHRRPTLGVSKGGHQAALRVSQVELRAVAIQRAQEPPGQEVVGDVPLVAARAAVLVLLDAEGVGEDGRAVVIGEAAQHALATGVVEVLLLVSGAGGPLRQVIQDVVGEDAGGAAEGAAGDVAQGIIAAGVVGSGEIGTGGPRRVDACQLVRAACITIEIALLRAAAIDGLSGLQRSAVPGETARATQDCHRYLEIPDSQSYVAHYSRLSRFPAVRQVIDLPGSPHAHRSHQFDTVPTAPRNALEFAPAPHQQGEGD